MKVLILILFVSFSVFAANHYVDNTATGGNDGTSWANAWESFAAINWSSLNPGDVLYISGGTDSTIYYEELHIGTTDSIEGTAGNPITIRNSYESGHNGRVIIDGDNETRANSILIGGSSCNYYANYITIKGLECRGGTRGIYIHYCADNIIIDSCLVYDYYGHAGIKAEGGGSTLGTEGIHNLTIRNCSVITFEDVDSQTDGIYIQRADKTVINDNFVHIRNNSLINSHSDGIQFHLILDARVYNNVVICDSSVQGMPMVLRAENTGDNSDSVIIYNNYMYMGGIWNDRSGTHTGSDNEATVLTDITILPVPPTDKYVGLTILNTTDNSSGVVTSSTATTITCSGGLSGGIDNDWDNGDVWQTDAMPWVNFIDHQEDAYTDEPPTIMIHNTMVGTGAWLIAIWFERNGQGMHRLYNNIIAFYGAGTGYGTWYGEMYRGNSMYVDSMTGGLYYNEWKDFQAHRGSLIGSGGSPTGDAYSWDAWVNTFGGTGVWGDPLFVDQIGYIGDQSTLDGELQSGSPAINAGIDVQAIVEGMGLPWTDINGVSRDSTPDIGAYEYQSSWTNRKKLFLK